MKISSPGGPGGPGPLSTPGCLRSTGRYGWRLFPGVADHTLDVPRPRSPSMPAMTAVATKEAEADAKINGRRRVIAGRISAVVTGRPRFVRGCWLVAITTVRRGDHAARESGRHSPCAGKC